MQFSNKQMQYPLPPPSSSPKATQAYNAVQPVSASKVHMTFPRPWWRDNPDRQAFVTKGDLAFR